MNALLPAAVVVGYLVGALSPATLAARRGGIDLRGIGSGNPGASNVGRALGRRTGVVVAVLDVLKGLLPGSSASGWSTTGRGWSPASPPCSGTSRRRSCAAAAARASRRPPARSWARSRCGRRCWCWSGSAVLGASRWIALASMSAALSLLVVALVLARGPAVGGRAGARRARAPPGQRRQGPGPAPRRRVGAARRCRAGAGPRTYGAQRSRPAVVRRTPERRGRLSPGRRRRPQAPSAQARGRPAA